MGRGYRVSENHLSFCTFALFVEEDGMVLVHDVGEEESSAASVWPQAATQVSPEGGFKGEVPRGWDAVLS